MPNMSALPHQKSFNRRPTVKNHAQMENVKKQIEDLVMEIILSVLIRLKDEIVTEKKNEMKF